VLEIIDDYRNFEPPKWFRPTVVRLLASLAPEHVGSLRAVVLTNATAIGKGKTRRVGGRKYRRDACLGFYHGSHRGQQPWIQLVVDNITRSAPPSMLRLQVFRDLVVSKTLFHEIGHHLDRTVGSASRGGEFSADDWQKRLTKRHMRSKYWYLRLVLAALRPVAGIARKIVGKRAAAG
jgi:hypothetical protein